MSDNGNSIVTSIDAGTHVATVTLNRPDKLNSFTRTMHEELSKALDQLERSDARALIITGAGRGFCAGQDLAMACDLIVAARSASFVQAFVKIGLVPDSGGTWLLPRRVGEARALGLALTGDKLGAEQAEAWGLVWKVVDDAELQSAALKLATQLAQQPAKAVAAIRYAIRASANNTLDQQLNLERDVQRELGDSHDYAEG